MNTIIETKYGVGKKYLRAKEVAEYLSIGLSTVWLYSKQGKITPKHISNRVTVWEISDIESFINSEMGGGL